MLNSSMFTLGDDYEDDIELSPRQSHYDDPAMKVISQVIADKKSARINGFSFFQFLTADALLEAKEGFFDRFYEHLPQATEKVRRGFSDKADISLQVKKAMDNPSDIETLYESWGCVSEIVMGALQDSPFSGADKLIFQHMVLNEILGLSVIDPLYREDRITEIIVNGPHDVQVEIEGQLHYVPACKFRDQKHLQNLFERMFSPLNKQVSRTTPQVKGRLADLSRVYAVDTAICPTGPMLNIRRHKESYTPPERFIEWGSASEELLEDIGNLIYNGASYLVVGGTGSGKTTLLSSLTGFIRDDQSVLTLEDNLEMKPAPHKMLRQALETMEPRRDSALSDGVTMRDLVKGALQMRPNWIIVGEVTDGAAYDMVQALATGHSGASTLHTDSVEAGIGRLTSLVSQGGVMSGQSEALPLIGAAVDLMIMVERFPVDGTRKITQVAEVPSIPTRNEHGELVMELNMLWEFNGAGIDERGRVVGEWKKVGEPSDYLRHKLHLGLDGVKTWEELRELSEGGRN